MSFLVLTLAKSANVEMNMRMSFSSFLIDICASIYINMRRCDADEMYSCW